MTQPMRLPTVGTSYRAGLIPAFIVMLHKASIPRIGEIMKVMISGGLNDATDAPSYGRHILPSLRPLHGYYAVR